MYLTYNLIYHVYLQYVPIAYVALGENVQKHLSHCWTHVETFYGLKVFRNLEYV